MSDIQYIYNIWMGRKARLRGQMKKMRRQESIVYYCICYLFDNVQRACSNHTIRNRNKYYQSEPMTWNMEDTINHTWILDKTCTNGAVPLSMAFHQTSLKGWYLLSLYLSNLTKWWIHPNCAPPLINIPMHSYPKHWICFATTTASKSPSSTSSHSFSSPF